MAETSIKLTKRVIDACHPGPSRRMLWDTELRGFGLRVETTGTKTFLVRFRPKGTGRRGPKRFVTLGRYGVITVEKARTQARGLLGSVAKGEDPAAERDEARGMVTVAEMADRYLDEVVRPKKKASTASLYTHYLKKLAVPTLGAKKVAAVTHADVVKLHSTIGKTRTVTANRVTAALSGMFAYAAKIGQADAGFNPAKGIEDFKEKPKQRYLSSSELARLGDALHQAETVGLPWSLDETKTKSKHLAKEENRRRTLDPYAIGAIRLLLLTGARLREALHARWDWFDAERGMLMLPDSKTGGKSLYLGAAALAVLDSLPKVAGNPFIFPGEAVDAENVGRPRSDLKRPFQAVLKAAGIDGVRLHDLRHTFAAYGAGAHLGLHVIGGLLGHAQPGTTARYAHLDADPMHRAVNTIGDTITAAMHRNRSGEVISLTRAKPTR